MGFLGFLHLHGLDEIMVAMLFDLVGVGIVELVYIVGGIVENFC